ncbi:MAG: hypothetical protein ACOCZL_00780 [Bacteroidota bacterium]
MKCLTKLVLLSVFITVFFSSCKETKTGFAIVVDTESYEKAKAEIDAYAEVLKNQGLQTYMLVKDYMLPDSLKKDLVELYNAETPIEGAVFIGEIPIAVVIDAQHLTSAFKMDQKRFGMETANVPSDRFYDDFDLEWDYIRKDTVNEMQHFYALNFESPQKLSPDIYSGRIKMPEVENKYELLRNYMKKVVTEHQSENIIDQFFFFAGMGYNSESLVARLDEQVVLDQQLPGETNITFLDHSMTTFIKFPFMSELQRENLDIAMLHHHGSEDTEYLSGWPKTDSYVHQIDMVKRFLRVRINRSKDKSNEAIDKVMQQYKEEYGIPSSWFEGSFDPEIKKEDSIWSANMNLVLDDFDAFNYNPNVRFAIFDACYNGSFHRDEYLAGAYIFSDGKTIAAQGNTVNSLQDKWPQEMIGLLSLGMRVGEWNRKVCYLETHIIGDPAFRFKSIDPSVEVHKLSVSRSKNNKSWLKLLDSQYPDVQALALRKLYDNHYENISELLFETYKNSEFGSVRTECLKLSSKINDENFTELLKLALFDNYELVQRFAVNFAGDKGSEELIPAMVKLGFMTMPERVEFNYSNNIGFFDSEKLLTEFEKQAPEMDFLINREEAIPQIRTVFESANRRYDDVRNTITDPGSTEKSRYFEIRTLRNYNYHMGVQDFISFLKENDNMEHRKMMLEALGWFRLSVEKQQIMDYCQELVRDESEPDEIRQEARKTILRLS